MRFLHERFRPVRKEGNTDPSQIFLYVAAPMMLGFQAIGSNLGFAMFWLMFNFAIAIVMLKLIATRPQAEKTSS